MAGDNLTGTKRPVGRPPNLEDTPDRLLRQELIAHLKLYRKLREIVESRITSSDTSLDADELAKYMDLLRRGIGDIVKSLAPASAEPKKSGGEAEDAEALLEKFLS